MQEKIKNILTKHYNLTKWPYILSITLFLDLKKDDEYEWKDVKEVLNLMWKAGEIQVKDAVKGKLIGLTKYIKEYEKAN